MEIENSLCQGRRWRWTGHCWGPGWLYRPCCSTLGPSCCCCCSSSTTTTQNWPHHMAAGAPHCCTKPTRSPPQAQLHTHITRLPRPAEGEGNLRAHGHSRLGFEDSECCCCCLVACVDTHIYMCRHVPLPSGRGFLLLLLAAGYYY